MPTNQPGSLGDHLVTLGIVLALTAISILVYTKTTSLLWLGASVALSVFLIASRIFHVSHETKRFHAQRWGARILADAERRKHEQKES